MGKSGGRRKKGGNPVTASGGDLHPHHPSSSTTKVPAGGGGGAGSADGLDLDPSVVFLKRAHELKEEGNRRFQVKDYAGALEQYDLALKLTPRSHPDRAVFHGNRAACFMQMRPVDYEAVASECSLALLAQPRYPRALLRRARALEALGRHEQAVQDVQALLAVDPTHRDALELAGHLRAGTLGTRHEAQQDLQSRPSPAALGASAVRGAPICGLGPCLPSRPVPKKSSPPPPPRPLSNNNLEKPPPVLSPSEDRQPIPNGPVLNPSPPRAVSKPFKDSSSYSVPAASYPTSVAQVPKLSSDLAATPAQWRPLKLVYDHDIRLAQMPANCGFRVLREIVSRRFPCAKSILIKYKDAEGDLVTVTSTEELRLAELCVDKLDSKERNGKLEKEKSDVIRVLRLHIVEVSPEQEPPLPEEEEEEEEKPVEDEVAVKGDESFSHSSVGDSATECEDNGIVKTGSEVEVPKEKTGEKECDHAECKEVEIDDWLFEFAQLFRTHVGIDPDAHLDLHELGMELCSEALEETVTSEDAQDLFEMAAAKFQEVAALAFFNWGNVHMCAARKRIPLDESSSKEVVGAHLQVAYDWVRDRYVLAGQKYDEALRIKPDFYEGLLALGQQHFEIAKLQWSFALANKLDLASWDFSETIALFNNAEEKMKVATEMWEKLEEQRAVELKHPSMSRKDELLKRRKKPGAGVDGLSGQPELSADDSEEQATVMRSQIHLFWGNMLFERSQVEFKLGLGNWKKNLDAAVERFKLAGASEADIAVVMKNHSSNDVGVEFDDKKVTNLSTNATETPVDDEDKHVLEN